MSSLRRNVDRIKGPWSLEEDDLLKVLLQGHGPRNCSVSLAVCGGVTSSPPGSNTGCLRSRRTTMNVEKLLKMAGSVRTGGKGTMRRKKKAVRKTTTTDNKRLQSTLKRIGVNSIPAIEEVNIFKDDFVIQFLNTEELQDILPGIINQLGPDNLDNLWKLAEQFQKQTPGGSASTGENAAQEEDDDEVPELVPGETFEAAAEEGHATS